MISRCNLLNFLLPNSCVISSTVSEFLLSNALSFVSLCKTAKKSCADLLCCLEKLASAFFISDCKCFSSSQGGMPSSASAPSPAASAFPLSDDDTSAICASSSPKHPTENTYCSKSIIGK